jgi:hypothetical protein
MNRTPTTRATDPTTPTRKVLIHCNERLAPSPDVRLEPIGISLTSHGSLESDRALGDAPRSRHAFSASGKAARQSTECVGTGVRAFRHLAPPQLHAPWQKPP